MKVKRKLTPEERAEFKRVEELSEAARENMQRILDEVAARRREREAERAEQEPERFWHRVLSRRT